VLDLKNHHTAFCRDCFFLFVERQTKRAIKDHRMFSPRERILVCVSGGKDSLALWDLLLRLGYEVEGLFIDLGITDYSSLSRQTVEAFAKQRDLNTIIISLDEQKMSISEAARRHRRAECSVCGTIKRHFFNRVAAERGFDVVATGHNLDDEAGRLLGNLLRWHWDYLARQSPVLPAVGSMLVRKVEPLCRLTERETAAYAILRGIDYILEECPMSRGATSLRYKQALNLLEDWMPGTKADFYQGFLQSRQIFSSKSPQREETPASSRCTSCGFPSYVDPCGFCRLPRDLDVTR
jgi:uncharacterized protein (TIGR00269 family)